MTNLTIKTIASSSTGNCYFLDVAGVKILIEAGVNIKDISRASNHSLHSIRACLISHEHEDHCCSVSHISKLGIPCYMTSGTAKKISQRHILRGPLIEKKPNPHQHFLIDDVTCRMFPTYHDAQEPAGFILSKRDINIMFATDTAFVGHWFAGLTHIMIECNFNKEKLKRRVNSGKVDIARVERLSRSHFELNNLCDYLLKTDLSKVQTIYLLHMSRGNLNFQYAKNYIKEATGCHTVLAGQEG